VFVPTDPVHVRFADSYPPVAARLLGATVGVVIFTPVPPTSLLIEELASTMYSINVPAGRVPSVLSVYVALEAVPINVSAPPAIIR